VGPDELLWKLPLAVVVAATVKAVCTWVHVGWMKGISQGVLLKLRSSLYERLLGLSARYYEQQHSGNLVARFTFDIAQVELAVGQALSSWVKDPLQVLAQLAVCAFIDARLFMLAFFVIPLMVWPVSYFARTLKKTASKGQSAIGELTRLASEQLQNLVVVQAFSAEPLARARFEEVQSSYLQVMKRSLFIRGAFTPTLEVLGVVGVAVAVGFGVSVIANEPELAERLVSFLVAALLMYQPLKALSGTTSQVSQGLAAAERLFEVLDAEHVEKNGSLPLPPLGHELRLTEVGLTYADGRIALKAVSLAIPAGQTVALVGPSGAGKSSLLSLLLGLEEPTCGKITWDGVDLAQAEKSSWRSQLAWVPQEPVLFSGTVRENLFLARPEATEEDVWLALQRANAEGFVRAFTKGLDEEVGERGSRLSGGQRQRLAIARAFLREPSLLILDEPTSSLDAAAEAEVQLGLKQLMVGRTTLVVAHRLSTVRGADVIFVLDTGRLVQRGTHDELVAREGLYAQLAKTTLVAAP
jgi:subfamily B ATP-binding cassette protein MsbA